jgi:hypothetical protein
MQTSLGRPQALPGRGLARCPSGTRPAVRTCSTFRLQKIKEESDVRRVECDAHAQHPPKAGLIANTPEKDACGVGFVGELTKEPSRKCVTDALSMLVRMTHRGACGCEENTGTAAPLGNQTCLSRHWSALQTSSATQIWLSPYCSLRPASFPQPSGPDALQQLMHNSAGTQAFFPFLA